MSVQTSGALSLSLELAPGFVINEVRWEISGGDMAPMSGTIDTSAPGATASVEVYGLPPGDDYLVELEARSEDGKVACRGSSSFDVEAGASTGVMVRLNCKGPEQLGGVRVNSDVNTCAELAKVVVSPLQTSVGNHIDLRAVAVDADGDDIDFQWNASNGVIADADAAATTYTCTDAGTHGVAIFVSDDEFEHCFSSWVVEVECVGDDGGACTTVENAVVYDDLAYIDDDGRFSTGTDAAASIASDCVFGSTSSSPSNEGCSNQARDVLACAIRGDCADEDIDALTNCVTDCQQSIIFDVTESTLSDECNACYGESVSCSAAKCATSGCSNPTSPSCIQCRCNEGCIPGFATCSGIPDDTCDGGGTGGTGGSGGTGGAGGDGGGIDPLCEPQQQTCTDGSIDEITPCCEQPVPAQASACFGDESLTNPSSCTPTGNTVSHKMTILELAPSCNVGYDLDACDGMTCFPGGLAPFEGLGGVDNALVGIAPTLDGVGGNLSGMNQAFSDALCGLTTLSEGGLECSVPITPLEIRFIVDANLEENCANVLVQSGPTFNEIILNLGEPTEDSTVCASGTIGTIPISLLGFAGAFENAVIRMTVSEDGFSDGLLGVTIDEETAVTVAELLLTGLGDVISQTLDISENLTQDTSAACNAISGTFAVGGIAEAPLP